MRNSFPVHSTKHNKSAYPRCFRRYPQHRIARARFLPTLLLFGFNRFALRKILLASLNRLRFSKAAYGTCPLPCRWDRTRKCMLISQWPPMIPAAGGTVWDGRLILPNTRDLRFQNFPKSETGGHIHELRHQAERRVYDSLLQMLHTFFFKKFFNPDKSCPD